MAEPSIQKQFKAVLVGGTGATGRYLLAELIKSKNFSEITSLGRRKVTLPDDIKDINLEDEETSGRLKQPIVDMENISDETFGEYFENKDVFFTTLGTTRKQAGSAAAFRHVDYDYNYNLAQLAKAKNIRLCSLLSSQGANKDAFFLYTQVKGQLEHDIGELGFPQHSIFRPGVLSRGADARFGEKIAGFVMGKMQVSMLATAICTDAVKRLNGLIPDTPQQELYFNNAIKKLVEEGAE